MINNVVLVGRLTKDIELKRTPSDKVVTSFTIACNRRYQTDGQPTADFINCQAWGKTAENMANYTRKGSLIGVEGRIQTRSYEDNNGKRVYITEVVANSITFLEPKNTSKTQETHVKPASNSFNDNFNSINDDNNSEFQLTSDDLPF